MFKSMYDYQGCRQRIVDLLLPSKELMQRLKAAAFLARRVRRVYEEMY